MKREIRIDNLYITYGKERFLNWCRSLIFFRFFKSHPYPDDLNPDRFIALTIFNDDNELQNLFNLLKIQVKNEKTELFSLETINTTFSGKAQINNILCYICVNKVLKTLTLEVSGTESDSFSLDDTTFHRAKQIDEFLSTLNIDFISSPYNDDYCITPDFYPEIWM